MSLIQTAYVNALLADASYVTEINAGETEPGDFKARLTEAQANYLAANFTVLSSIESAKLLGTGLMLSSDKEKPAYRLRAKCYRLTETAPDSGSLTGMYLADGAQHAIKFVSKRRSK